MTETELPALLGSTAEAIVDNAKDLGLTWTLRPATVQSSVDMVIYDGDVISVGVESLIGTVAPDDRVMMLQIPPGGNFIIGRPGTPPVLTSPIFRGSVESTGDVTLTTSFQAVTAIFNFDTTGTADYIVMGTADLDQTVSGGNNLGVAELRVDGVALLPKINLGVNAAAQRGTEGQTWYGTLAAGSHSFQLFASKLNNIGTFISRFPHTTFTYQVWQ